MSLYVVGGRQGRAAGVRDRDHSALYEEALVVEVDEAGHSEVRFRWRDPEWPSMGQVFKGASWDGSRLLLCTERALLWVDPRDWSVVDRWTHPWLNDVHHALVWDERLWVISTGTDAVLELPSDRGGVPRVHGVLGLVRPQGDQRAQDLRPHRSHPNHLFAHHDALWVTRFHQRDAVEVGGQRTFANLPERPHDGLSEGGEVWFTTVDGRLVRVGPDGVCEVALQPPDATGEPVGWCRGLCLDQDLVWVGFTRIRATRSREQLARAAGAIRGAPVATRRPTRIAAYTRQGALVRTVSLGDVGLDAVFGILRRG